MFSSKLKAYWKSLKVQQDHVSSIHSYCSEFYIIIFCAQWNIIYFHRRVPLFFGVDL